MDVSLFSILFPQCIEKLRRHGHTSVRIKVRAFVERGIMKYEILNIKGVLTKDKLPKRYVESDPSFWLTESRKTLKMFGGKTMSIGGIFRKATFERFMQEIDIAGDRLHLMNQHIEEVRSEFEGIRTIKI